MAPRWNLRIGVALAVVTAAGVASPQPRRATAASEAAETEAPPERGAGAPLRGSLGVPVAQRLVASADPEARLRGIARLGAIGTAEAVDALLEALEQGSPAGRDPKARLDAVRVIAPHAKRDGVRQLLTRELNDPAGGPARGAASPLSELIRGAAALALAKTGDKRSLGALANAIVQGGTPGEAAQRALLAYPPPLSALVGGKKRLPPELARFLGELGDLRAIERLRPVLEGADVGSQIAAAIALAKLGDEAALGRARAWLLKKPEPRLLRAAAEVLVYLGAPEAPGAIATLLWSEAARLDALRLAELLPSPALASKLAQAIPDLPEEARPRAVAALGRAGGADAIKGLRSLFEQPELATAAAFALATMPGEPARAALAELSAGSRVQKDRDLDRLLVRAAIVRAVTLGDRPATLEERLRSMLAAKDARDRAVAAFGIAALGLGDVEELAGGCFQGDQGARPACDGAVLHAAARGALARGGVALARFAALLESPRSPAATIAAGVALLEDPGGGAIPTSQLAAWAEAGGALGPLAARALGSRDDEVVRGTIKRLLEGSDPMIRAHVALGLGRDPEPDSVSLLAGAYRFEEDPAVRRAIVRALSRRAEVQRKRTLILARDLDPDSIVRSLARAALDGRPLDQPASPLATGVAWIRVVPNDRAAGAASRAARVIRSDGLAIPVVADPDGVILVPGMPPGPSAVVLASDVQPGDAGAR